MELALNMGAFEALDQQEMMDVDGGFCFFAFAFGFTLGWFVSSIIYSPKAY